ncbi:hypothetical protein CA13_66720 [Planctomycetes bacterium CA13]|uniref:Transposase IS200-like domain-containing protein n=1 Tax=Novipirellula herctigrandis TaxID=2527986 RepID=A0A5C5YML6_9BACT|nr:hypothetical protein CA13_66720 [Planctomycetes bacterium CA13]
MPRKPRYEVTDPAEVQVFHAVQRCVRRAFLCGEDPFSGQSYEHRRGWIRDRLEFLAGIFAVDCLTYTVLSNHLHLVLRSRPDVVAQWTDQVEQEGAGTRRGHPTPCGLFDCNATFSTHPSSDLSSNVRLAEKLDGPFCFRNQNLGGPFLFRSNAAS